MKDTPNLADRIRYIDVIAARHPMQRGNHPRMSVTDSVWHALQSKLAGLDTTDDAGVARNELAMGVVIEPH